MLEEKLIEYLSTLQVYKYSVIAIKPLGEVVFISNMPEDWEKDFKRRGLHTHSEIIIKTQGKITPLAWDAKDINNKSIQELSIKYGVSKGVTFFARIKKEKVVFTIYAEESDGEFFKRYNDNKHDVLFNILEIFERFYRASESYILTKREKEVMDFLKIGKTYSEIAIILSISERTVRFHVNNVLRKLDVTTVKHAIFKAAVEELVE